MFRKKKSIEAHINGMEALDAEQKADALDFIAWLTERQLAPCKDGEDSCWKVPYNGSNICKMWLNPERERVYISFFLSYSFADNSESFGEGFRAAMHSNVQRCHHCHEGCTGPFDVPIFGKELAGVCSQHTINFTLPDKETYGHIKALVEYCQKIEPNKISWHAYK
jgi:hypothetical protein